MKYNFKGFSEKANEALNNAIESAQKLGHTYVGSEHILLGLLSVDSCVACKILNEKGVSYEQLFDIIKKEIGIGTPTDLTPDYLTARANNIIETAIHGARALGEKYVGTEHILISILSEQDNYAIRFLNELGIAPQDIVAEISEKYNLSADAGENHFEKQNGKKTDNIEKFGRDLTKEAKNGRIDPVIGRDAEIERVIQILCRRTKNNPCLIGEPGVGKT
ncbi:MAG TPA: ATP-dependent Clp protease ATP-binding subunit ClpC, partial [Ruminococcaceae bacterium]|nr:ATP-dependent Clp protease ATP-binding subunit ClpC [Oscillospiraceae bacterium]